MAHIKVNWRKMDCKVTDRWKDIKTKLSAKNVGIDELNRSVYVIRLRGSFVIVYGNGLSPTIYIGEGKFKQRITSHIKWINQLSKELSLANYSIWILFPKVRNNASAYKEVEADLLRRFQILSGCALLGNRQFENSNKKHKYITQKDFDSALTVGSGNKPKWAIYPLISGKFYRSYYKTMNLE